VATRRLIGSIDRPLAVTLLAICGLGLYNLASAGLALGPHLYLTQGAYMAFGFALMAVVASIDYRNFEGLAVPVYLGVVGLLVATALFGRVVNGSKRWLPIPGLFNLQTSDLAKLAVVLIVAKVLHLEAKDGRGLTLDQIFRPLNVSRPLALVAAVLALTLAGDALKPAGLKMRVGKRMRTVITVRDARPEVTIGSGADAELRLRYHDVDRAHARLVRVDDGQYLVRDLDSAAGTYVNGERITGARELRDGDVVRFGLGSRAELHFSASILRLRPLLPWIAILAAFWLGVALFRQLRRGSPSGRDLVAPIDVVALPCGLILVQPDLGTTLVTLMIAFSIILYVGLEPLSLLLLSVFTILGGAFAWGFVLKPYQKERVMTFLDPTSDLLGAGYHQHQSLIAIGSGEVLGKGHGQGTQTQLRFLPEQQTDFIFSVWAEEHGFVGCVVVVALFALLILLSFRIATLAKDRFGALLVVGVTSMIFWHALVNMLMVLRLAPVVGVPLPLWSYGGSFVATTLIGLGIVFNVGMRRFVF
jgi:cell division protein FtsW (lipid II flippase)